jgi:hypothetical protein
VTANIHEPSFPRAISLNRFGVKEQKQKPHAGRWITPGCDETDDADAAAGCFGDEPLLENLWQQPAATLERFAFRKHMDGSLEFKGHLDTSGGAVSGTVAVTLPGAADGEPDYLLPNDQYWHTVITDGVTFMIALIFVDSSTGEITVTWPAS